MVIIIWQKLLLKMAAQEAVHPADLISRWMPLLADRILPGDLVQTRQKCHWARYMYIHVCIYAYIFKHIGLFGLFVNSMFGDVQ